MTAPSRKDVDPDSYWRRSDQAVARMVGGDIFLADPREGSIHALNPIASAVWRALGTPRTLRELCSIFTAAFPDADKNRMKSDLFGLLKTLEKDGLVSQVDRIDPASE